MKRSKLTVQLALCAALPLGALACDGDSKAEASKKKAEADEPKVQVQLPPSPNFDEGKMPEKYDDGAWSLYGLRRDIDENVKAGAAGTEITVRGFVQDVYVAQECPEGQACPPPKQPHAWITDKAEEAGKKRAMMLVNYRFQVPEWDAERWKGQPEVAIEKGKQYTFKGKFKKFSDTGFADDRGVLEFVAYRPLNPETGQELSNWVYPPGAPWHPVEIARVEEENQKLAERAAETADQYKKRPGGK